ncbi:MAG: tRNA uracil 4-sulfurtransferase ThiI, partial [Patescibacteria group bacterium]
GPGGLPLGTGGKAVALISGGIDSPVAAYLAMKRGVEIIFLHFHSYPYTNKASIEKVEKLVGHLSRYQKKPKLYLAPFGDIQKEILLKTPAKLRVVLYRRMMLRIAQALAEKEKALALITGESIGQVASQTLENMAAIQEVCVLPILRPLVGWDKEEIIKAARDIGSFDISSLPDQDCCSKFVPEHPETKAKMAEVKAAEKKLNIRKLFASANPQA